MRQSILDEGYGSLRYNRLEIKGINKPTKSSSKYGIELNKQHIEADMRLLKKREELGINLLGFDGYNGYEQTELDKAIEQLELLVIENKEITKGLEEFVKNSIRCKIKTDDKIHKTYKE